MFKVMSKEQLRNIEFIHHGHPDIDKNLFHPPRNIPLFPKPFGCFWASEFKTTELGNRSNWEDFFIDGFSQKIVNKFKKSSVNFKLQEDAKIILLEDRTDLEKIKRNFSAQMPSDYDDFSSWTVLDWERLSDVGYDGCYINEIGIKNLYYELYGWDVESICLFNLNKIIKK